MQAAGEDGTLCRPGALLLARTLLHAAEPGGVDIRSYSLFSGLTPHDAEILQRHCQSLRFAAGSRIFEEGEPARTFYLVHSGLVKIYKLNPKGQEQVLAVISKGNTFAEAVVFMGTTYPASAECLEDSELISVEREAILQILAHDPELSLRMMAGMALKLRRLVGMVEDLTLRDARGRLARYLSGLKQESGRVRLPTQQIVLARLLGLTGETLSRTMKVLRDEGILGAHKGREIEILNPDELRRAAGEELA